MSEAGIASSNPPRRGSAAEKASIDVSPGEAEKTIPFASLWAFCYS